MSLTPGAQGMAGGSDSSKNNSKNSKNPPKARRWVLQSPGRKPTTKPGDQANTQSDRAPLPPPHGPSGSPCEQAQQETSPSNGSSQQGWSPKHDSRNIGAPRADECLATTDTGEASAGRLNPSVGTLRSTSRSPMSRIRNKMSAPADLMKRFRRRSPNLAGGSCTSNKAEGQRSSIGGTKGIFSTDTTSQDEELPRHSGGGGGRRTAEDALTSPIEYDGATRCLGVPLNEPCAAAPDDTQSNHSHSSTQQYHTSTIYDEGYRGNDKLLAGVEREASRAHINLGVGEDAISAVKAGKQPPRIAFVGVFLNGVAVALASFAPFGEVDARIALVKSLLLEPVAVVRPGGCYTVRGSALAVHVVVDQKQRVYACITAEDVPFFLGLSLLEEVQIGYISTVATLAFSTKEHSHNTRCHAQMARSWAKYEGVERTLARERETRRLLREDPLDIESPAGSSRTYTGAEVTPLQFTAEHQTVLLAASREIFSLGEKNGDGAAVDNSDDPTRAASLGKTGHKKTKAALFATGVTGLFAGLYAARHTIFPF